MSKRSIEIKQKRKAENLLRKIKSVGELDTAGEILMNDHIREFTKVQKQIEARERAERDAAAIRLAAKFGEANE